MDKLIHKDPETGRLMCYGRDFGMVLATLHAYEELDMTPEDIEQTMLNFSSFLMEMTGGMMSKTNYTVQAMVSMANDHFEKACDECADRQALEGLANSYDQLQEINDRTFKSNLSMGEDLKVMKAELEEVKQERDALLVFIRDHFECDACKHEALPADDEHCAMCRGSGGPHWNWERQGAKDNNVHSKSATDTNVGSKEEE